MNSGFKTATGPADSKISVPPGDIEEQLIQLWETVLRTNGVGPHDSFFDKGGDSLDAMDLMVEIGDLFGVEINAADFLTAPTPRTLAELIRAQKSGKPRRLLVEEGFRHLILLRHGAKKEAALFIVPGGLGRPEELLVHMALTGEFQKKIRVYGFCSRADDSYRTTRDMARAYLEEMKKIQKSGPYFLIGECGGSATAFEIGRLLEESGESLQHLVLLESIYLSRFRRYRRLAHNFFRSREVKRLSGKTPQRLLALSKHLAATRPREWSGIVSGALSRQWNRLMAVQYSGLPKEWVKEKHMTYWRHVRRQYNYTIPDRSLACPVTVILTQKRKDQGRLNTGWAIKCSGKLSTVIVPGNHTSYIREHKAQTAQELEKQLFSK